MLPAALMYLIPIGEKEEGQYATCAGKALVEYGLIIALVAVLAIAGLIVFGPAIANMPE